MEDEELKKNNNKKFAKIEKWRQGVFGVQTSGLMCVLNKNS